jgi:hypothetical protein
MQKEAERAKKIIGLLATKNRQIVMPADDLIFLKEKGFVSRLGPFKNFKKLPPDCRLIKVINNDVVLISDKGKKHLPAEPAKTIQIISHTLLDIENNQYRHHGEG